MFDSKRIKKLKPLMFRFTLTTLATFALLSNYSFAKNSDHNFLVVQRKGERPALMFKENHSIKVIYQDSLSASGKYSVVNDSTISIGEKVIQLKEIDIIYATARKSIRNGTILMLPVALSAICFGSLAIDEVKPSFMENSNHEGVTFLGYISAIAGVPMFIAGTVSMTNKKKYELKGHYRIWIQRGSKQP
jgi:hypothetical protein